MTDDLRSLKTALGLAVSMLSAEHVFSASLSSPWTTGKLATEPGDETAFWRLFTEAAIASVGFSVVIGLILGDPIALAASVAGAVLIVLWMWWDYSRAFSGDLYEVVP